MCESYKFKDEDIQQKHCILISNYQKVLNCNFRKASRKAPTRLQKSLTAVSRTKEMADLLGSKLATRNCTLQRTMY